MEDGHFDALVRALPQSFSRRRLPQLFLTLLATVVPADDALAKKKKKKPKTKKPVTCKPTCRNGETCVKGVCRCASGTVCGGTCCTAGRICDTANRCCSPPSQQSACDEKCGDIVDACGRPVACGDCPAQACRDATCGGDNRCSYVDRPDNQQAPGCTGPGQLCCHGNCCEDSQLCFEQQCCTRESPAETCEGKCGTVVNNCGEDVACSGCENGFSCVDSVCHCASTVLCDGGSVCCGTGQICQENSCQVPANVDYDHVFTQPRFPPRIPTLHSVAVGSLGNVYTTDVANDHIFQYSASGVAGSDWGESGHCGGAGEPPCGPDFNFVFAGPTGIAVNAANVVFVADAGNNRIQTFSNSGAFLAQWGGDDLENPQGIAIDAGGSLYVADAGHDRVLKFDAAGTLLAIIGESEPDRLVAPTWVAVSADGKRVYVAEEAANTVAVYEQSETNEIDYEFVTRWETVADPTGLAVDGQGNVYVADAAQSRIRKLSSAGATLGTWGGVGSGNGEFLDLRGLAAQGNRVYAVDGERGRIQVLVPSANDIGFQREFGPAPDGSGQFREPAAVAAGPAATFFVADSGNVRIQELFTFNASFVRAWGGFGVGDGKFERPAGVAADSGTGHIYVSDSVSGRVQQFTADGAFVTAIGGLGMFERPRGIAVDESGNVYVVDEAGDHIYVFSRAGEAIRDWGGNGSGDGNFNAPHDLAAGDGHVYVADTGNNRIQKFTADGAHVATWGGFGSGDRQFKAPQGIAVDSQGNVYVADTDNHRWQKLTSDGQFVTKRGTPGAGHAEFELPTGIAVDDEGGVYIVDSGNHRIQKFIPTGAARMPPEQANRASRDGGEDAGAERSPESGNHGRVRRLGRLRRRRSPARHHSGRGHRARKQPR